MSSDESINNILKALYEGSSTIKMYVDTVLAGNAMPYTILIKDKTMEANEKIVERLESAIKQAKNFITLDTIMDNTNTDCLEILEYIKTGENN